MPGQGPTRYTSPEHAQGQPIVPASDVFACGCLLYYFLTGNHLIADSGTVKADEILLSLATDTGQRELNSRWLGLPHPLLRVLDGCLRFQAADRFADMEELDENLEIALQELNRSIEPAAHGKWRIAPTPRALPCGWTHTIVIGKNARPPRHSCKRPGKLALELKHANISQPTDNPANHAADLLSRWSPDGIIGSRLGDGQRCDTQ